MKLSTRKFTFALIPATLALAVPAFISAPSQAGLLHRHPVAAGVGAGLIAHHMAKHSHHHNMMTRHPMATAVGAGLLAHHMAKHH